LNSSETEIVYEEETTDDGGTEKQGSLFYDSTSEQLYWSDSKHKAIFRCSVTSLPCKGRDIVLNADFDSNLGTLVLYKCT